MIQKTNIVEREGIKLLKSSSDSKHCTKHILYEGISFHPNQNINTYMHINRKIQNCKGYNFPLLGTEQRIQRLNTLKIKQNDLTPKSTVLFVTCCITPQR